MALPTVPCYWTTRKNLYEQAIVRRRNQDNDFREKWSNTANYFHKSDVEMTKQRAWESEDSARDSMDAYKKEKEKEEKKEKLRRRRAKLATMLQRERDEYQAELKGYSRDNFSRLEDMKERAEGLKSAREEKRKQVAEEKLYEHWRQNNPDLRKIESTQMKDYVVNSWSGQVEERHEQLESARKEKEEYERQMEEERKAALELERQKTEEKLLEEKQFRQILRDQMAELQRREMEGEFLKREQEDLEKQQWQLEELESQRQQMEEARKKQDLGRVLLRQHRAQMRRRSKQVQEELELDKKILEALVAKEKESKEMLTARKEKARADAAWMKKVIDDQIRVEKAREAELDLLYQDEAARMWQKREGEWEKERQARERLMKEVLDTRQEQIEEKMEVVREQQEESLQRREQLVREMEIANQLTRREIIKAEEEKEALKLDLKEQITARREREESARGRIKDEHLAELKEQEDYEEFLKQETERMRLRGFFPKPHGRKQAWM